MTKVLKITELSNKGNVKEKYEMFQVGDYYISWDLKHIKKSLGLGIKKDLFLGNKYRIEEAIRLTKGQYNSEKFKELFKEVK